MTPERSTAKLLCMAAQTRKMTLEIEQGSDPISGRLADDRGTQPFSGWLELAAALQAALDPPDGEDVRAG
jgi:hypothetical protein